MDQRPFDLPDNGLRQIAATTGKDEERAFRTFTWEKSAERILPKVTPDYIPGRLVPVAVGELRVGVDDLTAPLAVVAAEEGPCDVDYLKRRESLLPASCGDAAAVSSAHVEDFFGESRCSLHDRTAGVGLTGMELVGESPPRATGTAVTPVPSLGQIQVGVQTKRVGVDGDRGRVR
jgi:hypothetical protein